MSSDTHTSGVTSSNTETGLDVNVAAALAYVLGPVSGLVMYLLETDHRTIRYHGVQSILVFGGVFAAHIGLNVLGRIANLALSYVPGGVILSTLIGLVLGLLTLALWLGAFVAWLYLIVRTYQEADPHLPVVGDMAQKYA
ncbi:DUF4870 domain-containing protein [Halococcoides cellulosivorans]|uniref:DUF4870 domain-containing protein n=1 Tax=Halococcoides cellulosivorans TaxID=1679096 RepID=A0A2R4X2J7_9EURY|nr:hypothetical protein [Halococcoides cellulosivorans]AWB27943.1 hypothetical protein HARCEL1_09585 [Halococcoides cellulosivorans]